MERDSIYKFGMGKNFWIKTQTFLFWVIKDFQIFRILRFSQVFSKWKLYSKIINGRKKFKNGFSFIGKSSGPNLTEYLSNKALK